MSGSPTPRINHLPHTRCLVLNPALAISPSNLAIIDGLGIARAIMSAPLETATLAEVAHVLGLSMRQLNDYMGRFEEIAVAIGARRALADKAIESALYKKACGIRISEKKVKRSSTGTVETTNITKDLAPDTEAAVFWLTNRQSSTWKRKQTDEVDVAVQINLVQY